MTPNKEYQQMAKLVSCLGHINDMAKYCLKIPADRADHLRDAYSYAQLQSKVAALKHLKDITNANTIVLGQWHGMLVYMLQKFGISKNSLGVEYDDFWHSFCLQLGLQNYQGILADATDTANWSFFLESENNLVVNTSCEHMSWDWLNFEKSNSRGFLYAQGNNYEIPDHINVCQSLDEFTNSIANRGFIIHNSVEMKFSPYTRYCVLASWN